MSISGRQNSKNRRNSQKQEQQAAADIGGRIQTNSGALRLGGGADVRLMGKVRIECKVTSKPTYTLKLKELLKLRKQSIETLEYPVFQFAFKGYNGMAKFAVIPWNHASDPTDQIVDTKAKQVIITEVLLKASLLGGRVKICFGTEVFEILHWIDFIERWNTQQEG